MGAILYYPKFKAFDSNGEPLVGGKLYAFEAGTSTPKSTYHDSECTAPQAQPIILDANGEALLYGLGSYKLILRDADDSLIWTVDGITTVNPADIVTLDARIDAMQGDISGIITNVAALSAALASGLDGIVSHVLPAFLAYNSITRSDVTGDNTVYTVPFNIEVFDQDNNFADNLFTAPITGKYRFDVQVRAEGLNGGVSPIGVLSLVTSNHTYVTHDHLTPDVNVFTYQLSVLADMEAGDTAYVTLKVYRGTKVVDVHGETDLHTFFSGSLVPANYLTKT